MHLANTSNNKQVYTFSQSVNKLIEQLINNPDIDKSTALESRTSIN